MAGEDMMRILVYTPPHVKKVEQTSLPSRLVEDFSRHMIQAGVIDADHFNITSWDALQAEIRNPQHAWDVLIISISLSGYNRISAAQIDKDWKNIFKLENIAPGEVIINLHGGLARHTLETKLSLMQAGFLLIHEDGDDSRLLHLMAHTVKNRRQRVSADKLFGPEEEGFKIKDYGWFKLELSRHFNAGRYKGVAANIHGTHQLLGPGSLAAIDYVFDHHNEWINAILPDQHTLPSFLKEKNFRYNLKRALQNLRAGGIDTDQFMRIRKKFVKFVGVEDQEVFDRPAPIARYPVDEKIDRIIKTDEKITLEVRGDRVVIRETQTIVPPAITPLFIYLAERPGHIPNARDAERLYPKEADPVNRLKRRFSYLREFLKETGNPHLITVVDGKGSYFGKTSAPK